MGRNKIHLFYVVPKYKKFFGKIDFIYQLLFKEPLYRNFFYAISWGKPIKAPESITFNVYKALCKRYKVLLYNWTEVGLANLNEGDLVIGHPRPLEGKVPSEDGNSWEEYDSKSMVNQALLSKIPFKKFILAPFNHSDKQMNWMSELINSNSFIAITGDVWLHGYENIFPNLQKSNFFSLNMCIDTANYPKVKKKFSPKGRRKFLYIGRNSKEKGIEYLSAIAKVIPSLEIGYISSGVIPFCKKICDPRALNTEFIMQIAEEYDFFINASTFDAQATTILEAMSWGFAVVCTRETGYYHPESIYNLPVDRIDECVNLINYLQNVNEDELLRRQEINFSLLINKYSWIKFQEKIMNCIGAMSN